MMRNKIFLLMLLICISSSAQTNTNIEKKMPTFSLKSTHLLQSMN